MLPTFVVIASICTGGCHEVRLTITDANRIVAEQSETIRIYNIDVPHVGSQCPHETQQAEIAMASLASMLAGKKLWILPIGRDYDGQTLAAIKVDGHDVGEAMVSEELASHPGDVSNWCSQ